MREAAALAPVAVVVDRAVKVGAPGKSEDGGNRPYKRLYSCRRTA